MADFQGRVDRTLERIVAAARAPGVKGDPYWREIFVAQAAFVELMPALARIMFEARQPLPPAAMEAFQARVIAAMEARVGAAIERESSGWKKAFDRRTYAVVAAVLGGVFVIGCLIGFAIAFRLTAG
ncbi:hypothetical protein [Rhodovastum atsumiense]|uniref:Uncharacterized protein n=1 Tax=Rhodovastum atsumiense TaxID=504468 RepID=A0A5M6ITG7_9PROT|nr:hypothetical protein [Rhodovastum atsumiense]KAA5611616.1 hypothetical protein F1189_13725 [Rhodovastum atsumiense]